MIETDQPVAALHLAHHFGGQLVVAKGELCAGAQLFARTDQTFPYLVAPVDEQEHLGRAAPRPAADEPCGQYPAVVEHQAVPGAQQGGEVAEMEVAHVPGGLVQGQQPGGVASLQRGLSDELRGKIEIKI